MKLSTKLVLGLLLVLVSSFSFADLFYRKGHPITFDGHIHMTTMNQFAQSLYDGEFPVTWSNNFANYGLPLPLFAHQLPAYLGAFLILAGISTELSYILLLSTSVILSSTLFYIFFRKFAEPSVAFTAVVMSVFFPYRILNIYTRGGLPELFATAFLPLLLIGVWYLQQKKYFVASVLLFFGTFLTILTHPMMLLIFALPVGGYFFSTLKKETVLKHMSLATICVMLGVVSATYYLIPLLLEMKYLYQANVTKSLSSEVFLSIKQLYDPTWFYTFTHPGPRGNYIKLGLFEFLIILFGILTLIVRKKNKQLTLWTVLSITAVVLMLPITKPLYSLPFMYQLQYPWRFLTVLQLSIPLIFIHIVKSIQKLENKYFLLLIIALVLWFRIPQSYGKNYVQQPEDDYYFNQANLHSINMNPVWTDNSENYPVKTTQAKIIEGTGQLTINTENNGYRNYTVSGETELRLVDYTFYFPGWQILVDGSPVLIEYQDMNYRGLITYKIPAGNHNIEVMYKQTKTRKFGAWLTILGLITTTIYLYQVWKKTKK